MRSRRERLYDIFFVYIAFFSLDFYVFLCKKEKFSYNIYFLGDLLPFAFVSISMV